VPGTLRIKDTEFAVSEQRSEFFAFIPQESPGHAGPWRLRWSIQVRTLAQEFDEAPIAPCLYVQELALDVRDWRLLEGVTVHDDGETSVAAYLDDGLIDERAARNSIRFVSSRGRVFTIEWECVGHVFSEHADSSGLPVQLNAELAFDGVHVWWINADAEGLVAAREIVAAHLDLGCLQEPEIAGPYHIVFPPRLELTAHGEVTGGPA
jgi:hypothetical protein